MTIDVATALEWMSLYREGIDVRADELNHLDAALGDGDCGASMQRGTDAVIQALEPLEPETLGDLFVPVGTALVSSMGGSSGPLYGTLFLRIGTSLGTKTEATVEDLAAALRSGAEGVMMLGEAEVGDKTMIDCLVPTVEALEASTDKPMSVAVAEAVVVARDAAAATSALTARRGRASYLGDGGVGHVDPGAVAMSVLFEALDLAVNGDSSGG